MKNLKNLLLITFSAVFVALPAQTPFAARPMGPGAFPPPKLSPEEQKELESFFQNLAQEESFFQNLAQEIEKEIEKLPPEERENLEKTFGPRPGQPPALPKPELAQKDQEPAAGKEKKKKLEKEDIKSNFIKPWEDKERKEHGELPDFKVDAADHYLEKLKGVLQKTQNTISALPIYQKEKIRSKQAHFVTDVKKHSWNKVLENLTNLLSDLSLVLDDPLYYNALFGQEFNTTRRTILSLAEALTNTITSIENQEDEDELPPFKSREAFEALVEESKETKKVLFRELYTLLQTEVEPLQKQCASIIKKSEKALERKREEIKKTEEEARKRHEHIIQQSKYYRPPYYPTPYHPQQAPYYPAYRQPQPAYPSASTPVPAKKPDKPETFTEFSHDDDESDQSGVGGEQFLSKAPSKEMEIYLKEEENIKTGFVEAIKLGDFEKADRLLSKLEDVELKLDKKRKEKDSWKKTDEDFKKAYPAYLEIKRQRGLAPDKVRDEESPQKTMPQSLDQAIRDETPTPQEDATKKPLDAAAKDHPKELVEEDLPPLQTAATEAESITEDLLSNLPLLKKTFSILGRVHRKSNVIKAEHLDLVAKVNNLMTKKELESLRPKKSHEQIEKAYQGQATIFKELLDNISLFDLKEVQDEMSDEQRALVKKLKRLSEIPPYKKVNKTE